MTTDLIDKVSELSGLDFSQDSYLREMINKHMSTDDLSPEE
ncbi:hypothetical protein ABG808_08010 [Streptococcus iniae]